MTEDEIAEERAREAAKLRAVLESRPPHMHDGSAYHSAQAKYAKEVPAAAHTHAPGDDELVLEVIGPEWAAGANGRYSLGLTDGYQTWSLYRGLDRNDRFFTLEEIVEDFPGMEWYSTGSE